MRVLVTGSSGQLGAAVAQLLSTDHTVLGLDFIPGPFTGHTGSVIDRDTVFRLVKNVDAVIHTASLHARHLPTHSQSDFVQTNIQGTLNILEACRLHGVGRLVYTSTTSLYGHALRAPDRAVWVTETLTPRPRDIYDVTKLAAEGLCQIHAEAGGPVCAALRVSRFFPEPERLTVLYRLYRGLDVRDAAEAHRLAMIAPLEGFQVFNISARTPFTEQDTPELMRDARVVIQNRCPDLPAWFTRRGWELPTTVDRVYVIELAERILGYHPRYNVDHLTGDQ